MTANVTVQSVVVAVKDQVSSDVGGEAVILHMQSGIYYGLDPVGARIWSLVQQPKSVADLREAVVGEFDVEPARCETDLIELLQKLLTEGLIELQDVPQS
jgi:hypothetical protein